jgi:CubicO group peptidase (beta-lactamase class C family)
MVIPYPKIEDLMLSGVEDGVFPGAVLLIGLEENILLHQAYGYASLVPEKQILRTDSIFDLASLTKPLATTLGIMALIQRGSLSLDQPLEDQGKGVLEGHGRGFTIRHLLAHSAGFEAYRPYYLELTQEKGNKKRLLREWVKNESLKYLPGEQTLYSDLGFIFLESIFEEAAGSDLHTWIRPMIYDPLGLHRLGFRPITAAGVTNPEAYAATEDCPWRQKVLRGEVHDENAYAVGGISGQAGLFGPALEIFHLLRELKGAYDHPEAPGLFAGELVRTFWERQPRPLGTTRALGFDTPSESDSSAGQYFSPRSVGHLGFTGTSFWLDLEKDLMVILLTNRVHSSRTNERIKSFRPLIHDLIFKEIFVV